MTSKMKYVAAGFLEDAGKLLSDFIETENFIEFTTFASVWKKHHFSLIFMGRPNDTELTEFTNEVFRITTHFLSSSFTYQVGAIFMLYALYRNQISNPPIKIRITFAHWEILNKVLQEAIEKKYRSLHYVIDYLISHAFMFVKNLTLKGPVTSSLQNVSKKSEKISNLNASYKIGLHDYSSSSKLPELLNLQKQYLDIKKNLDCDVKLNKSASSGIYEKLMEELDILQKDKAKRGRKTKSDLIGNRRAQLKASSFSKNCYRLRGGPTVVSDDDELDNDELDNDNSIDYAPKKKKCVKKRTIKHSKRPLKHKRKVGRPRKNPQPTDSESEIEKDPIDNISITNLVHQQQDFYLPPEPTDKGRNRPVRFPYYKLSPKYCEDTS